MHLPPPAAETWVDVLERGLPTAEAQRWAVQPDCGAVVSFTGVVRDNSEGRDGVTGLTYEAYVEHVVDRMAAVVAEARRRWPAIRRVAVLHRVGALVVGEDAVLVVVSSPHRAEAFAAASFCIDTVKATAPIWKRESWATGEAWADDAVPLTGAGVGTEATR